MGKMPHCTVNVLNVDEYEDKNMTYYIQQI